MLIFGVIRSTARPVLALVTLMKETGPKELRLDKLILCNKQLKALDHGKASHDNAIYPETVIEPWDRRMFR